MAKDKDNDKTDLWEEWTSSMNDLRSLTDRTFDRVTSQLGDYSGQIRDQVRDQIEEQGSPWFRHWYDETDHGSRKSSRSWRRRCHNELWAFPVPTSRQYDACKEKNGLSLWNRDGAWSCILPEDDRHDKVVSELNQNVADSDKNWFSDYSVFLDWRRAMIHAEQARQRQKMDKANGIANKVKYISEEDATSQGKKCISKNVVVETKSLDDGSLETKTVVQKWYDDGTTSRKETTKEQQSKNTGWFWK